MILDITTEPAKILHQVGALLTEADFGSAKLKKLVENMTETMYCSDGVGIAAPQVGQSIQLCVIAKDYSPLKDNRDLVLINPVWTKQSILKKYDEEGCLSVPNVWGQVKRYTKIKVQALDINGKPLSFTAKDYPARVIQHEVDHLNGILFIEKAKNLRTVEKM